MKHFPFMLLWFLTGIACGQQPVMPEAYVYTIAGKAAVIKSGKQKKLAQKDWLFSTDTITIQAASSLTLCTKDFKFLEITRPGTYPYNELEKTLNHEKTGVMHKLAHFIWHDLFKPENVQSVMSPEAIGGAVGGSKRGCDLKMYPSDNYKTNRDTLRFVWRTLNATASYQFTLKDESAHEIINIITRDTQLVILSRGLLKENSGSFSWNVLANDGGSSCATSGNSSFSDLTLFATEESKMQIEQLINTIQGDKNSFRYCIDVTNTLAAAGWYDEAYQYSLRVMDAFKK